VFGGEQWRPLLHVRDVAGAIKHGIDNRINGLFNLHSTNCTIKELANNIVDTVTTDVIIHYEDMPFEDLRNYRTSSDKFLQTGWRPTHTLTMGITELANVLGEGRVKKPSSYNYSNEQFLMENNIDTSLPDQWRHRV